MEAAADDMAADDAAEPQAAAAAAAKAAPETASAAGAEEQPSPAAAGSPRGSLGASLLTPPESPAVGNDNAPAAADAPIMLHPGSDSPAGVSALAAHAASTAATAAALAQAAVAAQEAAAAATAALHPERSASPAVQPLSVELAVAGTVAAIEATAEVSVAADGQDAPIMLEASAVMPSPQLAAAAAGGADGGGARRGGVLSQGRKPRGAQLVGASVNILYDDGEGGKERWEGMVYKFLAQGDKYLVAWGDTMQQSTWFEANGVDDLHDEDYEVIQLRPEAANQPAVLQGLAAGQLVRCDDRIMKQVLGSGFTPEDDPPLAVPRSPKKASAPRPSPRSSSKGSVFGDNKGADYSNMSREERKLAQQMELFARMEENERRKREGGTPRSADSAGDGGECGAGGSAQKRKREGGADGEGGDERPKKPRAKPRPKVAKSPRARAGAGGFGDGSNAPAGGDSATPLLSRGGGGPGRSHPGSSFGSSQKITSPKGLVYDQPGYYNDGSKIIHLKNRTGASLKPGRKRAQGVPRADLFPQQRPTGTVPLGRLVLEADDRRQIYAEAEAKSLEVRMQVIGAATGNAKWGAHGLGKKAEAQRFVSAEEKGREKLRKRVHSMASRKRDEALAAATQAAERKAAEAKQEAERKSAIAAKQEAAAQARSPTASTSKAPLPRRGPQAPGARGGPAPPGGGGRAGPGAGAGLPRSASHQGCVEGNNHGGREQQPRYRPRSPERGGARRSPPAQRSPEGFGVGPGGGSILGLGGAVGGGGGGLSRSASHQGMGLGREREVQRSPPPFPSPDSSGGGGAGRDGMRRGGSSERGGGGGPEMSPRGGDFHGGFGGGGGGDDRGPERSPSNFRRDLGPDERQSPRSGGPEMSPRGGGGGGGGGGDGDGFYGRDRGASRFDERGDGDGFYGRGGGGGPRGPAPGGGERGERRERERSPPRNAHLRPDGPPRGGPAPPRGGGGGGGGGGRERSPPRNAHLRPNGPGGGRGGSGGGGRRSPPRGGWDGPGGGGRPGGGGGGSARGDGPGGFGDDRGPPRGGRGGRGGGGRGGGGGFDDRDRGMGRGGGGRGGRGGRGAPRR